MTRWRWRLDDGWQLTTPLYAIFKFYLLTGFSFAYIYCLTPRLWALASKVSLYMGKTACGRQSRRSSGSVDTDKKPANWNSVEFQRPSKALTFASNIQQACHQTTLESSHYKKASTSIIWIWSILSIPKSINLYWFETKYILNKFRL